MSVTHQAELYIRSLMEPQDIRILKVLEAVENNGDARQRVLAEKLGISLGLVNTCFRKLATAGYFKGSLNIKGRVTYELTRKGSREKARLTYEFILSSYRLYKEALTKLTDFFTDLEAKQVRRLVFFGVNDFSEIAYLSMKETSLEMVAVVDEKKFGQRFFGQIIGDVSVLGGLSFDRLLITDTEAKSECFSKGIFPEKVYDKVIFTPFQSSIVPGIWSAT